MKRILLQLSFCLLLPAVVWAAPFYVGGKAGDQMGDEWGGEAAASYTATTGNTDTQALNLEAKIKRETRSHEVVFGAGILYGREDGDVSAEKYWLTLRDTHFIDNQGFIPYWSQNLSAEKNIPAGYRLSGQAGVAAGVRYKTKKIDARIEAGPAVLYEEWIESGPDAILFEPLGRAYAEGRYRFENFSLAADAEYLYPADDQDNYRVDAGVYVDKPLYGSLVWRTGYELEYVNQPPKGAEHTDTRTSTAIVLGF